ncbi:MAG: serine/threonine-protein phosphatase [Candidatus Uhrbacteria bacterium]|nr:serine/threonine-protein phosphatase [Candidatus Uhrbacteria bacterium]
MTKEAYMKAFEDKWSCIHEGCFPESGVLRTGTSQRKPICEDVKLKNHACELFLVTDGGPAHSGWFAPRETASFLFDYLGEPLDQQVRNTVSCAQRDKKDSLGLVTKYVAAQMLVALEIAHNRVRTAAVTSPGFSGSFTTISLVKLVGSRFFFTSIGNSRIYLVRRGGTLQLITEDDSLLQLHVREGRVSREQAYEIDQSPNPRRLSAPLRQMMAHRGMLTRCVGIDSTDSHHETGVGFIDLSSGDRFVIASDGLSDQISESEIEAILQSQGSDERAEETLQKAAMEISMCGNHPRSTGDDISVIVQTIH